MPKRHGKCSPTFVLQRLISKDYEGITSGSLERAWLTLLTRKTGRSPKILTSRRFKKKNVAFQKTKIFYDLVKKIVNNYLYNFFSSNKR